MAPGSRAHAMSAELIESTWRKPPGQYAPVSYISVSASFYFCFLADISSGELNHCELNVDSNKDTLYSNETWIQSQLFRASHPAKSDIVHKVAGLQILQPSELQKKGRTSLHWATLTSRKIEIWKECASGCALTRVKFFGIRVHRQAHEPCQLDHSSNLSRRKKNTNACTPP